MSFYPVPCRFVIALAVLAGSSAGPVLAQAQTAEQKAAMERRAKVLKEVLAEKKPKRDAYDILNEPVMYLLERKKGVPIVEDAIVEYRKADKMDAWEVTLAIYQKRVKPEDMPDRMIAEYVVGAKRYYLLKSPSRTGFNADVSGIFLAGEFGKRGKEFIPVLEAARDQSSDDGFIRLANDTLRRIKE